jgi:hypothetical protein
MVDLAVLVADKNMEFALKGILDRPEALGIRRIRYEIRQHSGRDGGVRSTGPETLALLRSESRYGLLVLDWEGSGCERNQSAVELEAELDQRLGVCWGTRTAKAIVIEPELDVWMWGSNNLLADVLGWSETRSIREWLITKDYQFSPSGKPLRPKEALEDVLRHLRRPRSAAVYRTIAAKISLQKCTDLAFGRLKTQLQGWF